MEEERHIGGVVGEFGDRDWVRHGLSERESELSVDSGECGWGVRVFEFRSRGFSSVISFLRG